MNAALRALGTALVLYAVGVVAGTEPARAEIASVGGSVTIQATPTTGTVTEGTTESANVSIWFESEGFLGSNQSVQHDGTAGNFATFAQLTSGTLFAGTYFQSYLVQFDPVGAPSPAVVIGTSGNATITFTNEIIGVFADSNSTPGLNSTDGTFAPTTYNFLNSRRFENNSDTFTISTDRRTLTITRSQVVNQNADQLRILINPEPSTGLLFGLGLAGAVLGGRRRRQRTRRRSKVPQPTS